MIPSSYCVFSSNETCEFIVNTLIPSSSFMLMCQEHHHFVDEHPELYTVERLTKIPSNQDGIDINIDSKKNYDTNDY